MAYSTQEVFGGGKIDKFGESRATYSLKFSSPIFTDIPEMYYFGICTDCSLFAKFFLPNSFYLYSSLKFPPPTMTVDH